MNRYFEEVSDWDEEAIELRSKLLGELICKEWPMPTVVL
jgi:hypothetical protein